MIPYMFISIFLSQFALHHTRDDKIKFNKVSDIIHATTRQLPVFTFMQEHMGLFRKIMLEELLSGCLM